MIPTLKGFTQQLVPVNGIKINAVTGGSGPDPSASRLAGNMVGMAPCDAAAGGAVQRGGD